jgi:hypothetical protein
VGWHKFTFVRVEPNFALAAADNGRRKALLGAEIDPTNNDYQYTIVRSLLGHGARLCEKRGCHAIIAS